MGDGKEIEFVRDLWITGTIHGHGRQSGIVLHEPAAWAVELRDGRLLRVHNFIGREAVDSALGPES